MDFFEHQDVARKKTGLLVFYFILSVALIVAAVYSAVALIFLGVQTKTQGDFGSIIDSEVPLLKFVWNPELFLLVAAGTLAVILLGSLYKIWELASGGEAVAQTLGGRLLNPSSTDLDERKLLNIVEEMAIASGIPVPPVYLLEHETGINAFAAGFTPSDAVIGVTRGCIQTLSRDELQGVIAHEFSHILNGDMRLNIRLMGLMHGILLLGLIGYWILRSAAVGSRRSRRDKGGGGVVLLLGLALVVIGYTGVFFARLIKSALSRQREFLADASAVQFTRNPAGIAGALKKIGGLVRGARIGNSQAEQASHLFFGNALIPSFLNLMSTHPPLEERIKRIDPSFDGKFAKVARPRRTKSDWLAVPTGKQQQAEAIGSRLAGFAPGEARHQAFAFQSAQAVANIGAPSSEHLTYAVAVKSTIPQQLTDTAHEPFGARAVIYGLLLDEEGDMRKVQMQRLQEYADPAVYQATRKLLPLLEEVSLQIRLPLVDMCLPALRELSADQYRGFRGNVNRLIKADQKIQLFEYVLHRMLLNHLDSRFKKRKLPMVQYYSLRPMLQDCERLLSCLAHAGHADASAAGRALQRAAQRLSLRGKQKLNLLPKDESGPKTLDQSLKRLAVASPGIKKRVLGACAACIEADGFTTIEEGELLRVFADSLGCPMPPLLGSV